MLSPTQYKFISDQISELQSIEESSINHIGLFENETNDLSDLGEPVNEIKTTITNLNIVLNSRFTEDNNISDFVRALQEHILNNTIYTDINDYLKSFNIYVWQLFADVSARIGYPIDSSNIIESRIDDKLIYVTRSYWLESDVAFIKSVIDSGKAAGYDGIISITSQWDDIESMIIDKDGRHPIERVLEIQEYCNANDFKFIWSFLDPRYTDNYSEDPTSDVVAEGYPADDMRFIVQGDGSIIPDPDDLTRVANPRFNFINPGFEAQAAPRDSNWWSASNTSGWIIIAPNAGNYYDPNERNYPLLVSRDTVIKRAGTSYSIKIDMPAESTWQPNHAYAGTTDTLLPPQSLLRINGGFYFTIAGGTSGATEPDWTLNQYGRPIRVRAAGEALYEEDTLIDGTVSWTYFGPVVSPSLSNVVGLDFSGDAVVPHTYIHVSFWVRFDGYVSDSTLSVSAIGRKHAVNSTYPSQFAIRDPGIGNSLLLGTEASPLTTPNATMPEWQQIHLTFNTANWTEIQLAIETSHTAGTMWMSEFTVEPAGIMNVLRRTNTPFVMTSEDGLTTYQEGVDYTNAEDQNIRGGDFDGAVDPTIKELNSGKSLWHDVPNMRTVNGGALSSGDVVLCSYYHVGFYRGGWRPCMNDPEYLSRLVTIVETYIDLGLDPYGYHMSHDEIRLSGWDPVCQAFGNKGQSLAANIEFCYNLLHDFEPDKPIYLWSDMYDPYHNAALYPIAQNANPHTLSWEGLNKNIIITNWNFDKTLVDSDDVANADGVERYKRSLDFFDSLDHDQILAGYYDDRFTSDPTGEDEWYQYAQNVRYAGTMYSTFVSDYSDLQVYIDMVNDNT